MLIDRFRTSKGKPPLFLRFRASTSFIAFAVAIGVLTDMASYSLIVPVVPYRLVEMGYSDVNSKTGWLVATYGAGLIVSSPVAAWVGVVCKKRQPPLIFALLFMAFAIVLFMEVANYPVMLVSRILQGFSGSGIWTLGLALVTDSVPEHRVGEVMGYVMIGFSTGTLIGPPLGGILYDRMGYRAPFVFALILVGVDLLLRIFIIEKADALVWVERGVDIPGFEAPGYKKSDKVFNPDDRVSETAGGNAPVELLTLDAQAATAPALARSRRSRHLSPAEAASVSLTTASASPERAFEPPPKVSQLRAVSQMLFSPRPATLFLMTMINGIILGGLLDASLTLWLKHKYGLSSLNSGLVFIATVVPNFVISPLAGAFADKKGAKAAAVFGLLSCVVALPLDIIRTSLPGFVVLLAVTGAAIGCYITPILQDLFLVIEHIPGLSTSHVYGCFNFTYSVGAFLGPIIAGQINESLGISKGWTVMCIICAAFSALLVPPALYWVGGPLEDSLFNPRRKKEMESQHNDGIDDAAVVDSVSICDTCDSSAAFGSDSDVYSNEISHSPVQTSRVLEA